MSHTTKRSSQSLSLLILFGGFLLTIIFIAIACDVASNYPQWHKQVLSKLLWKAVMQDDAVQAEKLLKEGANVNIRDEQNHPLLVMALTESHDRVARVLLRFHPDVNAVGPSGSISALTGACGWNPSGRGSIDIVQTLLAEGADVIPSALSQAAYCGNADIVSLLLKSGANPQLMNYRGETVIEETRKHYDNALDAKKKERLKKVLVLLQSSKGR